MVTTKIKRTKRLIIYQHSLDIFRTLIIYLDVLQLQNRNAFVSAKVCRQNLYAFIVDVIIRKVDFFEESAILYDRVEDLHRHFSYCISAEI